ncbi:MAG TPA: twin-arginine translocase subunit TatB, partial [Oceanospirillales bacterium]|nr:twin-arginine translocase subunit TatB [Oceanospirillales bacterium]
MFDIGFSELFMILVIALVVIGPERLPGVARKIGRYVRKAKETFENVKREVESELETEELNRRLAENNILQETKELVNETEKELKNI